MGSDPLSALHCTSFWSATFDPNYSRFSGTNERVCLISGSFEGIIRIHDFIMDKIREKPDPNAKMAIDFDHKQPAEREKQVSHLNVMNKQNPNDTVF